MQAHAWLCEACALIEPGVAPSHSEIFHTVLQARHRPLERCCALCCTSTALRARRWGAGGRAGGQAEESTACRLSVCAAVQFDMIGVELDDLLVVQSALIAATGESHAPRQELDSALLFLARTGLADLLGVALPKASLPFPERRNPQLSPVAVAGTTVRLTLRAQMR